MITKPPNFKQFLLIHCQHPELGPFARRVTSDRNWAGVSVRSLRSHLKSINAAPEVFAALQQAELAWNTEEGV